MRKITGRFGAAAGVAALMGLLLAAAIAAPAQTFTTLHSFDGTDGANPQAALVQATDGNLYGTSPRGGGPNDQGTVFKVTTTGTLTTIYSFCALVSCIYSGAQPLDGLLLASDGTFYGTALNGMNARGTVFKLTTTGALTVLYNFCAQTNCTDGATPHAGLIQANNGDFYGTTQAGGVNNDSFCYYAMGGCGTVFKITPAGTLTTLYSFCAQPNCADGDEPVAGLVQGTDGNFYGTTPAGGNINSCVSYTSAGCGTIFKITPNGTLTVLHTFDVTDGSIPVAGLIQGTDGNFYGTTSQGGNLSACNAFGCGTIFKVTPGGALTTLYSFCAQANCADGSGPTAGLVQATDGNFYGTTSYGGSSTACTGGCGTIFRITPAGVLTTLHSFDVTDGAQPSAGLVQATSGAFYGTTIQGGSYSCVYYSGCGTIFRLSVGLGRFVETLPTSGKVGVTIKILGSNLKGASSVTFNGIPATFKVISPSEIGTSVPTGATTGPVQVVTPSGTLTSNVNFRVQ
ncbi:MAG TPA: choice-of-anchor tandem repeat GloVer-containing protein [Terriglobia bacterium]|nr:choice-of-anchor tandem repeat GloVer-containing protein [Terriglobia bacterium]